MERVWENLAQIHPSLWGSYGIPEALLLSMGDEGLDGEVSSQCEKCPRVVETYRSMKGENGELVSTNFLREF